MSRPVAPPAPSSRRRHAAPALLSLLGLLALAGCAREPAPAGDDPIIATVDGQPIKRSVFVEALLEAQGDAFFQRYVERFLADREAEKAGITVDDAAVKAEVDEEERRVVEGRFRGDRAAFAEQIGRYGLSIDDWRAGLADRIRTRLLVEKLLAARVDEKRVEKLFELRYGPGGVQRKVSHIHISTVPAVSRLYTRADFDAEKDRVVAEARARAEGLHQQLAEGADFAELARAHSDDPSAQDGGDLGALWGNRFGGPFDAAVARLSVGDVSPVIESRLGLHIAQVTGIRKGATYEGAIITVSARISAADDERTPEQRFADALTEAKGIQARLKAGEDFATLAQAVSADPVSRGKGGALGKFAPGRLGGAVDAVLETLPIGQISAPVRTEDGYALVRLDARTFLPAQDTRLVRHILVGTTYPRVKARKLRPIIADKAREKAQAVLAEAKGGADFAALARAHSEHENSRRNGGNISRFRVGALGASVDEALAAMKVGEVRLVEVDKGYEIVRLDGEVKSDYAQVRDALEKELKQKPVQPEDVSTFLDGLRSAAEITKNF